MKQNHLPPNLGLKNFLFLCIALIVTDLTAQNNDVVIVDEDFPNKTGLMASLPVTVQFFEINTGTTFQHALEKAFELNSNLENIHLFCTSGDSSITIGDKEYSMNNVSNSLNHGKFKVYSNVNLLVYSCSLAKNTQGTTFLEALASETGFIVASCFSCETIDEELQFDFSTSSNFVSPTLFK